MIDLVVYWAPLVVLLLGLSAVAVVLWHADQASPMLLFGTGMALSPMLLGLFLFITEWGPPPIR